MSERKSVIQAFGGWVGIALMVSVVAAVMAYEWWQHEGSGDALQEIASELGISVTAAGKRFQMRGRIDDLGVEVKTTTDLTAGDVTYYTWFEIYAPTGPTGRIVGIGLRQQAIDSCNGEQRLWTGDQAFDDEVFVGGDPANMLAFLSAETRTVILPAVEAGWSLERATWSAARGGRMTDADEIRALLTLGINAARAARLDSNLETALRGS